MSETMSSPSDWPQFYQQNLTSQMVSSGINPTNDPITISSSNNPHASSGSVISSQIQLSPEGRVSKPARRRSRASRRTPTTLLNTDTTNFRAMVQQFTGGPSAPFGSAGPHPGGPGFSFGQLGIGGARQGHVNPTVMFPPGYRLQYQQNQPWMNMISLSNSNSNNQGEHQGGYVQRGNMEMSDGFVMGNIVSSSSSAAAAGSGRGAPTNENRGNTFMF